MKANVSFVVFILFALFFYKCHNWTPVVLMHGVTTSANDLNHVVNILEQQMPGVYVHNTNLSKYFESDDSILWNMNKQVSHMCKELKADQNLTAAGKINIIGFSQGGLVTRGFLERCNDPPVEVFVSWVSPQAGVYGVPNFGKYEWLPRIIDCCVYNEIIQDLVAPADYWKDSYNYDKYLSKSSFLADLNNEKSTKNQTYKDRVTSVQQFLLSYSTVDVTLIPRETGWWDFYQQDSESVIVPLYDTQFYQEDWLGIKTLNETGRLYKFTTSCEHQDYHSSDCFDPYFIDNVIPFLKKY